MPTIQATHMAYLGRILPPKVTQNGLGSVCPFLSQVDHSQSLPSVFPLIPFIRPVNTLGYWMQLGLALALKGVWLQCY